MTKAATTSNGRVIWLRFALAAGVLLVALVVYIEREHDTMRANTAAITRLKRYIEANGEKIARIDRLLVRLAVKEGIDVE